MNSVIKADQLSRMSGAVRPLFSGGSASAPEQIVSVETVTLRRQAGQLTQQLEQASLEIERLRSDVARAYHEGEAEGRRAGALAVERDNTEALRRLGDGVESALRGLAETFDGLDELAIAVATAALGKILSDPAAQLELAASAIRRQLDDIEGQSVLAVEVSATDFPGEAEVARWVAALNHPEVETRVSADLKAGQCQIRLRLGVIEVGLAQQRGRLQRVLQSRWDEPG